MKDIVAGSGNVYADLGYENAEEMKMKASLVGLIGTLGFSHTEIAHRLNIKENEVVQMLQGHFKTIDIKDLTDFVQSVHYG